MPGKPLMLFTREERILLKGVLIVVVVVLPQHVLPRMRVVAAVPPVGIECVVSALAQLGFWAIIAVPD
jgi:hypothetical protein